MPKRRGLPEQIHSRHNEHYVDDLANEKPVHLGEMIPLGKLIHNSEQPRKNIGDLSGLKESIKEKGILEPILVKIEGAEYRIISGERRYRAALEIGMDTVPCIVRDSDDQDTLEVALIENLQRKDLSAFEEADGLKELSDKYNLGHSDIAKKIGKSRSTVSEVLTLTYIPEDIRALCQKHGIESKSMLLQIARQETHAEMLKLANEIINKGLKREDARKARQTDSSKKVKPFTFRHKPEQGNFSLVVRFKKSEVDRHELIHALEETLKKLKEG